MFFHFYLNYKNCILTQQLHTVNKPFKCWKRKIIFVDQSTIWYNKDCWAERYICAATFYLFSILEHAYSTKSYCNVVYLVNGRNVVDDQNATEKILLSFFVRNVKLHGSSGYDINMTMYTKKPKIIHNYDKKFSKNTSLNHHIKLCYWSGGN